MMLNNKELRDKWKKRIEFILEDGRISEWEQEFIDSIQIWLEQNEKHVLSWKQEKCLNSVYLKIKGKQG